jgi:hypothetical protein
MRGGLDQADHVGLQACRRLPITSSLIQGVPNSSRASFGGGDGLACTLRQPAVLGRTVTPSSRISDQKAGAGLAAGRSRGGARR